jgi:hypothetical protein
MNSVRSRHNRNTSTNSNGDFTRNLENILTFIFRDQPYYFDRSTIDTRMVDVCLPPIFNTSKLTMKWQKALGQVKKEISALTFVMSDEIHFTVEGRTVGGACKVRLSDSVWPIVIQMLQPFEVVGVDIDGDHVSPWHNSSGLNSTRSRQQIRRETRPSQQSSRTPQPDSYEAPPPPYTGTNPMKDLYTGDLQLGVNQLQPALGANQIVLDRLGR